MPPPQITDIWRNSNKYESQSLKQKRTWKNKLSRKIIMLRKTIINILKDIEQEQNGTKKKKNSENF